MTNKTLLAASALTAVVAYSPAALAHDTLISSNPADAAVLTSAPARLSLTFNTAPMSVGHQVALTAPDGTTATLTPTISGTTASIPFTSHGNGGYSLRWRVVSSDGHPISGTLGFTVKEANGAHESRSASSSSPTSSSSHLAPPPAESSSATPKQDAQTPAAQSSRPQVSSVAIVALIAGFVIVVAGLGYAVSRFRRR